MVIVTFTTYIGLRNIDNELLLMSCPNRRMSIHGEVEVGVHELSLVKIRAVYSSLYTLLRWHDRTDASCYNSPDGRESSDLAR